MSAKVFIQPGFHRCPGRRPVLAIFINIIILPSCISRYIVVAIAGYPSFAGILVKTVAPRCIRKKNKILF